MPMKPGGWGVVRKKRSYVEVWIFLLLLFSVNFFEIVPITNAVGVNGAFTFYLLSLFFMFTFNRRAWIRDSARWLIPLGWFLVGILLSFIPALIYYGQSFSQSFFTNRRMFELAAFPILIALRPDERELRTPLYAFSVLYLVVCFFVTYFAPNLVLHDDSRAFVEDGNFVHTLPGIRIVFLAYVFAVNRAVRQVDVRNLAVVLLEFIVLFIAQNRTTLIAAVLVLALVIYLMRMNMNKLILMAFIGAAAVVIAVYTAGQWEALYRETVSQLTNPDYNRTKSIVYMFSSREWPRYLFGDGFISANVNPLLHVLQESGIYHSDVGFVGMWHQYGIIPVLTVIVMTVKGLSRKKSFLVRMCAFYILIGALTLSYFALSETLLWLSVYLYLFYASDRPDFAERPRPKRIGWSSMRYRSISRS